MGRYPRQEILAAFESYKQARDEASRSGDWNVWADCFTKDAHYIEHAYGDFQGRDAIRKWICEVMAPFPTMTFPQEWWVLDEERDAIVFCCQNQFPEPFQADRCRPTPILRSDSRSSPTRPTGSRSRRARTGATSTRTSTAGRDSSPAGPSPSARSRCTGRPSRSPVT